MNLPINQIHLMDCIEGMKQIESGSIDMILTDLPYGITKNHWDSIIPLDVMWEQYKRILKPNGVVALTASQPFTSMLVMSNVEMFRHEWIWVKSRGSNFANTVREPFKEHESVLIFSRGKWVYNKQMQERSGSGASRVKYGFNTISESTNYRKFDRPPTQKGELRVPSSVQKFNVETGKHPTQKPVTLFEYLIRTYTNEGDLVLDSCMGSGTTAIAAIRLGRNYIGFETNEEYHQIACERIREEMNVQRQMELF